eukprot:gene643-238_t
MGKWKSASSKKAPALNLSAPPKPIHRNIKRQESLELCGDAAAISISLDCPLGQVPIKLAVRGRLCTHLQVFDRCEYVNFMRKKEHKHGYLYKKLWKCPVCSMIAKEDLLVHDEMLQSAIVERGRHVHNMRHQKALNGEQPKKQKPISPRKQLFDCYSDSDVSDAEDEGMDVVFCSKEYPKGWKFKKDHDLSAKFEELNVQKEERNSLRRQRPRPTPLTPASSQNVSQSISQNVSQNISQEKVNNSPNVVHRKRKFIEIEEIEDSSPETFVQPPIKPPRLPVAPKLRPAPPQNATLRSAFVSQRPQSSGSGPVRSVVSSRLMLSRPKARPRQSAPTGFPTVRTRSQKSQESQPQPKPKPKQSNVVDLISSSDEG